MIPGLLTTFAATSCSQPGSLPAESANLLKFPTWYEYLPSTLDPVTHHCTPSLVAINDVWLIVAAVIDILLRVVAILAVVFIIYGGVQYMISNGSPERTDQARKTIISAVVGLVIAVMASVIIGFIASSLTK